MHTLVAEFCHIESPNRAFPWNLNLTTVFWGLFRPRRALIVPNFVIGCILTYLL